MWPVRRAKKILDFLRQNKSKSAGRISIALTITDSDSRRPISVLPQSTIEIVGAIDSPISSFDYVIRLAETDVHFPIIDFRNRKRNLSSKEISISSP